MFSSIRGRAISRRGAVGLIGAAAMSTVVSCSAQARTAKSHNAADPAPAKVPDADAAWRRLAAGNKRFAAGRPTHPHQAADWRRGIVAEQHPFACVLGCVDSRVSPELVFDQGLGDLLIARTAGEVLDEAVIGSVEYGVAHLGIPLVVVLGHADCGAVKATIEAVRGEGHARGDVAALVHAIEPAVRATRADEDPERYLAACVAEQARRVARSLAERSELIERAVKQQKTRVVSATYDLRSGRATLLS